MSKNNYLKKVNLKAVKKATVSRKKKNTFNRKKKHCVLYRNS